MIRIDLGVGLKALEKRRGSKVSLGEVAEKTGVHRNILSRIINNPRANTSSEHVGKLVEFFFYEYLELGLDQGFHRSHRELMSFLVASLIQVFPERSEHGEFLKTLEETGDIDDLPMYRIWEFFDNQKKDQQEESKENLKSGAAADASRKRKSKKH